MLLLRTEGIASSFIEGLRVSLVDVAAAEIGDTANPTAKYIADNLATVVEALGTSQRAMTIEDVHNWHRRLMKDSDFPPEIDRSVPDDTVLDWRNLASATRRSSLHPPNLSHH